MYEKLCKTLDIQSMEKAKNKLNNLSKPLDSLGWIEDTIVNICGILKTDTPNIDKKAIVIMCADNGVVEEGVSQVTSEITKIVTNNFTKDITAVNKFSSFYNQDLHIIDIGINSDMHNPKVINKKIMYGTNNITKGRAMSEKQALEAINVGIEAVTQLKEKGYTLIGTGEMGIGNTTTSTAILYTYLENQLDKITGRGAGLSDEGLKRKIKAIKKAIKINNPDKDNPIDVLSKVGGLDIAGMVGIFIGGAINSIPIIIDGYISSIAALVAYKICNNCKDFMIPSHKSDEPGSDYVFKQLQLHPALDMKMRLGEGTGASIIMGIIDLAFYTYYKMGTFEKANVKKYERQTEVENEN